MVLHTGFLAWALIGFCTVAPSPKTILPAASLLVVHYLGVIVLVFGKGHGGLERLLSILERDPDAQFDAWLWLAGYVLGNVVLCSILVARFIRLRREVRVSVQKTNAGSGSTA